MMPTPFTSEIDLTRKIIDVEAILSAQLRNDIQIVRGEDYQYLCYINGRVYATGLTPMFALAYGVKLFMEEG
jgi:hypothetical protein